jgi:hypothetical protein
VGVLLKFAPRVYDCSRVDNSSKRSQGARVNENCRVQRVIKISKALDTGRDPIRYARMLLTIHMQGVDECSKLRAILTGEGRLKA